MQFKNLAAFSPLFPSIDKYNYASSVTFFLSCVDKNPALQQLLQHTCSINLISPKYYFAFDEALEKFGVKFIKQNIGENCMDIENLKSKIISVQAERDRLSILLSEYVRDLVLIRGEHAVKS